MSRTETRATPPKPKRKTFIPERPNAPAPVNNMKGERLAPMTFNMPKSWHTEFKTRAVTDGYSSMKDLLIECFEAYKRENGAK